jgi:hypothetical protein
VEIAESVVPPEHINPWNPLVFFRLHLETSKAAGYSSCYLTSPALVEYPGLDEHWEHAANVGGIYFIRQGRRHLDYGPVTDAFVNMKVPGQRPDRSELDGGGFVRGDSVQLTCAGEIPRGRVKTEEDAFYIQRTVARQPSCASIQTFRASDATEDLNRRLFLAGVVLSAAVAILLEALAIGKTSRSRADL